MARPIRETPVLKGEDAFNFEMRRLEVEHMSKEQRAEPVQDAAFIETLAQRMGWTMRKRRTSVERFINSCPKSPQMTDGEIQAEINAVRYGG